MTDSDPNVSRPDFTDSGKMGQAPSGTGPAAAEPQIEFLCPNGHRLHGPATLQGRPGECPECGSRFRIPTYEDVPTESPPQQEISLGRSKGREESDIAAAARRSGTGYDAGDEATPALVARLWKLCPEGASIELRLRNGETLAPKRFLARASKECRQGVFSVIEADGSITLIAVPWDAVDRIAVRGLKEVPPEWAE